MVGVRVVHNRSRHSTRYAQALHWARMRQQPSWSAGSAGPAMQAIRKLSRSNSTLSIQVGTPSDEEIKMPSNSRRSCLAALTTVLVAALVASNVAFAMLWWRASERYATQQATPDEIVLARQVYSAQHIPISSIDDRPSVRYFESNMSSYNLETFNVVVPPSAANVTLAIGVTRVWAAYNDSDPLYDVYTEVINNSLFGQCASSLLLVLESLQLLAGLLSCHSSCALCFVAWQTPLSLVEWAIRHYS